MSNTFFSVEKEGEYLIIKLEIMKKLSNPVSPFLMLIIPVILLVGLSLALKEDKRNEEFVSQTGKNKLELHVSEASVIKLILKK